MIVSAWARPTQQTQPVREADSDQLSRRCVATVQVDVMPRDLAGLRELARLLRPMFDQVDRADDCAAAAVNRVLHRYAGQPTLVHLPERGWTLRFVATGSADPSALVGARVSAGLAAVFESGKGDRLRVCAAARCDRVFVDLTRRRHQRFCGQRCAGRSRIAARRARAGTHDGRQ